jgi:hypothetical protein
VYLLACLLAGAATYAVTGFFEVSRAERVVRGASISLTVGISGLLSSWIISRRSRRHLRRSRVDCSLSVLEGEHPGLRTRWRHGSAALEPGRMTFTPFVLGLRLWPRKSTTVDVLELDRASEVGVSPRQALAVSPDARLVRIRTGTGAHLRWAVSLPAVVHGAFQLLVPETPASPGGA